MSAKGPWKASDVALKVLGKSLNFILLKVYKAGWLISCFARASSEFDLTISIKRTNIMEQDASSTLHISVGEHTLEVVENFTYLGFTISSNLCLDAELNMRISKATVATSCLVKKRVWNNSLLTTNTRMTVCPACAWGRHRKWFATFCNWPRTFVSESITCRGRIVVKRLRLIARSHWGNIATGVSGLSSQHLEWCLCTIHEAVFN